MARSDERWFDIAPENWQAEREHRRKIARVVNGAMAGKTNNVGTVTLATSGTTTTITDERIGYAAAVIFVPLTEQAATESPWPRVTAWGDGSATVTHAVDAAADRDFMYVVVGAIGNLP